MSEHRGHLLPDTIAGTSFLIQRTFLAARRGHCRAACREAATHLTGGQDRQVPAGHVTFPSGALAARRAKPQPVPFDRGRPPSRTAHHASPLDGS